MNNNTGAFLELMKAGLWADAESTDLGFQGFTESVDWEKVYQLAEEQSVIGLVLEVGAGDNWTGNIEILLQDEMLSDVRRQMSEGRCIPQKQIDSMTDQELAVQYNDHVIYPDKVRLNCYYYQHNSFVKDFQMIICTVFGKKMEFVGEVI